MILLYHGSGSQEVILEDHVPDEVWQLEKGQAIRLLRAQGDSEAADVLDTIPFELRNGTNGFNDEFSVLHYSAPLKAYLELAQKYETDNRHVFSRIAEALRVVQRYVRFITLDLSKEDKPQLVAQPTLIVSSAAVERALADAEQLLRARGSPSAVDRVHTAFHGYLRALVTKAGIPSERDANITTLFRLLRSHPAFGTGPRASDIERVIQSLANIVDCLNPVRNRATGAHPNEEVLDEPEATLVINSMRTLLHYIDSRVGR